VELAAELQDLISQDLARLYPALKGKLSLTVIDSNCHLLSLFDRAIASYTTEKFKKKNGVRLVMEARVTAVTPQGVEVKWKKDGRAEHLPAATVVWATGIALHPLAASLAAALPPGTQTNRRSLTTDTTLCVKGSPARSIFAMGDAATVEQSAALAHAEELFSEFDGDASGTLEVGELEQLLKRASKRFPHLGEFARLVERERERKNEGGASHSVGPLGTTTSSPIFARLLTPTPLAATVGVDNTDTVSAVAALFTKYDANGDGRLDREEFKSLLGGLDSLLRSFPATAQVAKQQGEYLATLAATGDLFGKNSTSSVSSPPPPPPFQWRNKGMMAFVGENEAVAQIPGLGAFQGFFTGLLWKGFETSSQMSYKSKTSVALDQFRSSVFGRDISTGGTGNVLRKQSVDAKQAGGI